MRRSLVRWVLALLLLGLPWLAHAQGEIEAVFWRSVRCEVEAEVRLYLEEYPNGAYVAAARECLEQGLGLDREDRILVQRGLAALDYSVGTADGLFGPATRRALRAWQAAKEFTATGYLTREQAATLIAQGREAALAAEQRQQAEEHRRRQEAAARAEAEWQEQAAASRELVNSIGMEFVRIEAGEFEMGSPSHEAGRDDDEGPVHRVRISQSFYLGKYEVTQGQWVAVMGDNPSHFASCGASCPVESVSWKEVQQFIRRLNAREGVTSYRLPTEAEWEYAARAGTQTAVYTGELTILGTNNAPVLDEIAWYGGNSGVSYSGGWDCSEWDEKQYASSRCGPHPVGGNLPNGFGLYDMIGNVWEWVADRYGAYPSGPVTDPQGPPTSARRVYRGGGWFNIARNCRAADRYYGTHGYRNYRLGVRLARTP